MDTKDIRKYELMVVFSGDLTEANFEKELEEFKKTLKENAKEIFYEESWGKRDFAYRVKKQKRGYYMIFDFTAEPVEPKELRVNIKLNPHILRHLMTVLPENYEPEGYKKFILLEEEQAEKRPTAKTERTLSQKKEETVEGIGGTEKPQEAAPIDEETSVMAEEPVKLTKQPKVAGKEEEEQLKTVEKKLEKILENPDIDIR